MIEKILCFLVIIICLVYGLALLSWLVMKLDIEKRRSKRTKFFERMGENLMEIEKLKDMLRNAAGGPVGVQMCQEAADALEQLQAENGRLQAELEKEEAARKKQADILYELRGQKYEQTTAIDQLRAENDRLRRERDAAVELLQGQCEACSHFLECEPEDEPCNSCNHIRFSGGEDHWQWLEAGEVKS